MAARSSTPAPHHTTARHGDEPAGALFHTQRRSGNGARDGTICYHAALPRACEAADTTQSAACHYSARDVLAHARHMAQYFVIHPENPQRRLLQQAAAIVRDG